MRRIVSPLATPTSTSPVSPRPRESVRIPAIGPKSARSMTRPKGKSLPINETVTFRELGQIFKWMESQHDIAFGFPSDGCYARAHLMIRRMQKRGLTPYKVWAFKNGAPLHVCTTNDPKTYVEWDWHTAPVLRVRFENVEKLHDHVPPGRNGTCRGVRGRVSFPVGARNLWRARVSR